jgi:hypothetical protein
MIEKFVSLQATAGHIREAHFAGRRTLVVPIVGLVGDIVVHCVNSRDPEFIPLATLRQDVHAWNDKPLTLNHPRENGAVVSASTPGAVERFGIGTVSRARVEAGKLLLDGHLDVARAEHLGASRLLDRLRAGEVVDVSIGATVQTVAESGVHQGKRYEATWKTLSPDHVSILEHSRGACAVSDGCGTRAAEVRKTYDEWMAHYLAKLGLDPRAERPAPNPYESVIPRSSLDEYQPPNPYAKVRKETNR